VPGTQQSCALCGNDHAGAGCPQLVGAIGAADRTSDLAPVEGKPSPLIGREIGEYEVLSVLGAGSFGTVYRARHRTTHEEVAIKLMHKELVDDAEAVRRFVGEARATLLVAHDNVVQVKTIDLVDGKRYYIVLELLEGETLEERCERGPFAFEDAAPLLRQMCDALGAAHAVGIVHRDLKPENIYLARQEHRVKVKVVDFGIARRSHLARGESRTRQGLVLGTPQYLSPEQSLGLEVDQRTDVYSLGVIAFRMLTGRLPFTELDSTKLILAHRLEDPPRPSSILPALPPFLDELILKALVKNPDGRYQTMDQFESAIARADAQYAILKPKENPEVELLKGIEAIDEDGYYRLFDVREGASAEMIAAAAARLDERLSRARAAASGEMLARVAAAEKKVAEAKDVLLNPRLRVAWDAKNGNFVGVARALSTGFDAELLSSLREVYLLGHPGLEPPEPYPDASLDLPEAEAEKVASELARRLRLDPLNIELHRRYWPLRNLIRKRPSGAATLPA
jgi:serine/threonine protein kinase